MRGSYVYQHIYRCPLFRHSRLALTIKMNLFKLYRIYISILAIISQHHFLSLACNPCKAGVSGRGISVCAAGSGKKKVKKVRP